MYIGLKMNTFVLHEFTMGDVEDPHIYVSAPIYEWQKTKHGKWAMEHGTNIKYHISPDDYSNPISLDNHWCFLFNIF